ncbi:alpha/beta-hydrolase [Ramaria rubella]|nr:alpha/beta-hydrolase [Ramaria rubella]
MSLPISKTTLIAAGLSVNVYSYIPLVEQGNPLAVLFLLHGRQGFADMVGDVAENVLRYTQSQPPTNRDLIVVTFDHRNHGSRLMSPIANNDWKANNDRHALDMYAIQRGSASDVAFLIDFLPPYLFPSGEREVQEWIMSGISLGGHSTWIVLKDEPRVKIGIPIIGCPDYLALMGPRAQASGLSVAPPHFPASFLEYIKTQDPSSTDPSSSDPRQNPFLNKHILVLSGAVDPVVPWIASEKFVRALQVGNGTKKVIVEENAGHECTPYMVKELASFVWEHGVHVKSPIKASY